MIGIGPEVLPPFLCPALSGVWSVVETNSEGLVPFLWLLLLRTMIGLVVERDPSGFGLFLLVSLAAEVLMEHFHVVARSPGIPVCLGRAIPPGSGPPSPLACPWVLPACCLETTYSEGAENQVVSSDVWAGHAFTSLCQSVLSVHKFCHDINSDKQ